MSSALFVLILIYLSAIIFSTVISTVLYVRSSRSAVYYALIYGNLAILASLSIRLFELLVPDATTRLVLIHISLICTAIILVFLFQLIYTLVTRNRLPLLLQMIEGAGVLVLYVVSLNLLPMIKDGYLQLVRVPLFTAYLILPMLLDAVFVALMVYAIRAHLINMTVLSFAWVMTALPDTVFVFDKTGAIVDTNCQLSELGSCRNREELSRCLTSLCEGGCDDLVRVVRQPGRRSTGEFAWVREDGDSQTWVWSSQSVHNQRGHQVGSYLLLSDRTRPRGISLQLQRQNSELRLINRQLSDYTRLVGQYAEASTRQEVAAFIDTSVRQRLNGAARQLQTATIAEGDARQSILQTVISDCRQALADIRTLVGRLTE